MYKTLLSLTFFTLAAGGQLKLLCAHTLRRPAICARPTPTSFGG